MIRAAARVETRVGPAEWVFRALSRGVEGFLLPPSADRACVRIQVLPSEEDAEATNEAYLLGWKMSYESILQAKPAA